MVFRRLNPATGYAGTATIRPAVSAPLPYPQMERAVQLAGRPVRVPNWMLAASCAAALGLSLTFSAGLSRLQSHSVNFAAAQSSIAVTNPRLVWSGSTALAQISGPAAPAANPQIVALQSQAQSMNSELQQLQHDNDALRNLTQQQSGDLTSARSVLASSQDTLSGQSQDLNSRLQAIQQDLGGQISQLQTAVKSADGIVSQIRKMLGMPPISS